MFWIGGRLIIGGDRLREVVARGVSTVFVAEERSKLSTLSQGKVK